MEVMMATTVAKRMTNGRENFWIRVLIAFILTVPLCVGCALSALPRVTFFAAGVEHDQILRTHR
jgi:hypothetical protein